MEMDMQYDVPEWGDLVFAHEYDDISTEDELKERETSWLDRHLVGGDFDDFWKSVVEPSPSRKFVPGKNRAYSIESVGDGLNCEGRTAVGGLVGSSVYDKEFEVVIDYEGGLDPQTGIARDFASHVSLRDEKGENYGHRMDHEQTDVLPERGIAGLYLLSQAFESWKTGDREHARELGDKIDSMNLGSPYINRRLAERNNNF